MDSVKIHGSRRIATPSTPKPVTQRPSGGHWLMAGHPHLLCFSTAPLVRAPPYDRGHDEDVEDRAHRLCDVALQVGEDQPTLCGDWDRQGPGGAPAGREAAPRPPASSSRRWPGSPSGVAALGRPDFTVLVERLRRGRRGGRRSRSRGRRADEHRWSTSCTTRTSGAPSPPGRRGPRRPAAAAVVAVIRIAGKGPTRSVRGHHARERSDTGERLVLKPGGRWPWSGGCPASSRCSSTDAGHRPGRAPRRRRRHRTSPGTYLGI